MSVILHLSPYFSDRFLLTFTPQVINQIKVHTCVNHTMFASHILAVALQGLWNCLLFAATCLCFIYLPLFSPPPDKIPVIVSMFQKHDRNISDSIFIKDSPITFDVKIHDPSYYLNNSAISYKWNFGDGSGLFVASGSSTSHTYTLQGNFTLNLTVQAIIPVPCRPVTPTAPPPTSAGKHLSNSTGIWSYAKTLYSDVFS